MYSDGLVRTAPRFYAHTADKHALAFVPDTADHSFRTCKLFRALIDFVDLSSEESEHDPAADS